jgi:hypothetical protein
MYDIDLFYFFSSGLLALGFAAPRFIEVLWVDSSLEKGIKSGAPGRYFRRGSGTLNPYKRNHVNYRSNRGVG